MQATFYNCTSDNNVLNKTIVSLGSKEITLTGENVKESPRIVLEYDATIINANYCYIPTFGRYYYIKPHEMLTGGRIAFNCSTDLLMSAKSDILKSVGTFTRSNRRNVAITDPLVMKTSTIKVNYRRLGTGVPTTNKGHYLMTIGG